MNSETNLKIKQASPQTATLTSPALVTTLRGSLRSEQPNNSLYTYEGTFDLLTEAGVPKQIPVGPDQILLRGAQIRNTPWAYGFVVFTGHETKLMRNATYGSTLLTSILGSCPNLALHQSSVRLSNAKLTCRSSSCSFCFLPFRSARPLVAASGHGFSRTSNGICTKLLR